MTYRIEPTARAEADIDRIHAWLSERSSAGADRWYESFWEAVERLRSNPFSCALAREDAHFDREIHDLLFRTPKDHTYRALFTVEEDCVRILAVRGPGERPMKPEDFEV